MTSPAAVGRFCLESALFEGSGYYLEICVESECLRRCAEVPEVRILNYAARATPDAAMLWFESRDCK